MEKTSSYTKYRLIDYFDVWGNEEDGFEVNNLACIEENIIISDDSTNEDIINYLFKICYLNTNDCSLFEVENNWDMIEISLKNGFPVCRLEVTEMTLPF